jgi:hypothetical protein
VVAGYVDLHEPGAEDSAAAAPSRWSRARYPHLVAFGEQALDGPVAQAFLAPVMSVLIMDTSVPCAAGRSLAGFLTFVPIRGPASRTVNGCVLVEVLSSGGRWPDVRSGDPPGQERTPKATTEDVRWTAG